MPFPYYTPEFKFDPETQAHLMVGPTLDQVRHDLVMAFMRDTEGKIKQALIDLGWRPPGEASTVDAEGKSVRD